jgi:hypothetical protein
MSSALKTIDSNIENLLDRQIIDGLDLEPIKVKLMDKEEGLGWSLDQCDEAEKWYKRFLYLCKKYPDSPLVPVGNVDNFWHQHILDTTKYADDCDKVFGYFLHHFPYFGLRGDEDAADLNRAATETCKIFEEEYDESPFGKASKCAPTPKCNKRCFQYPSCKPDAKSDSRPTTVRG